MATAAVVEAPEVIEQVSLDESPGRVGLALDASALVDLAAVCALVTIGLWGFRASFGGLGFLVVGVLGLALGAGIGYLTARLRLSSLAVGAIAVVAVIVLAGVVALPRTALFGAVPTLDTVTGLLHGFTGGWKDLVTIPPPVGSEGDLLAIPYLCGFLGGLLGVSGAFRSTRLWWGALPPTAVLAAGILTGVSVPVSLLVQGAGFAFVLLGWAALRERRRRTVVAVGRRQRGRGLFAVALLLVAALVGLNFYQSMPGANSNARLVMRSYVDPDVNLAAYPSPLSGLRLYLSPQEKDKPVFTVKGLPPGTPIRLAVMDVWDGTAFGVAGALAVDRSTSSGEFVRTGEVVPTTLTGTPAQLDITVDNYDDHWVPTVGGVTAFASDNSAVDASFRYNAATDSAVDTYGLTSGDHLTMSVVVPTVPAATTLDGLQEAAIAQPVNAQVPDDLTRATSKLFDQTAATGPYLRAQTITQGLAKGFYAAYAGPQSRAAGHGFARLSQFFDEDPTVGDEEQYGAAAALMTRSVGVPTRLVMGFRPKSTPGSTTVTVYGHDISTWLEVDLAGVGWVPVAPPTPDRSRLPQQVKIPEQVSHPQVQPPPPPKSEIDQPPPVSGKSQANPNNQPVSSLWLPAWVGVVALYVGVPLLLIALLIGAIVGAKTRRSRRRRRDPDTARAVTGGWADLLDHAADRGYRSSQLWTRNETTAELGTTSTAVLTHFPDLAHRADAAAFGPTIPTADDVSSYWADVETAQRAMSGDLGFWRSQRARLSLRSLRLRDLWPGASRRVAPPEGTATSDDPEVGPR